MHIVNKAASGTASGEDRIGALAVLPVFFKLEGRRVLIAGGSDAAAWKAELMMAAGAEVHVFGEDPGAAMAALAGQGSGGVILHKRPWSIDEFAGMALAIADADTDGEARAFACAARSAGVPFNVIDKPAFCQFSFGSIVNRSPAVIGISTDGAAPILGQAIRRRIETLLPPSLARWAGLARDVRVVVNDRLRPGPERRRFWERLSDRAFGPPPTDGDADRLIADAARIADDATGRQGRVTLVGAGPGDAELLTLKAMRALQAADIILHDDLVSDDVLELARREAKRMLVGKRGGRDSCRQEDINATMIRLAKAGKHVVRLKGGDPMIFGRAGEEIAELHAAGIPVAVVPGVTSALAMAAALGVSLTHRDHARSVRFVTGHSRNGDLPADLDWQGLSDPVTTTIVYMGGRTAARLSAKLTGHGLSAGTPVVVARAVGRPGQSLRRTDLAGLSAAVAETGLDEPLLIGIGRVFAETAEQSATGPVRALSA